jgi:hypothetical protein
MKGLTTKRGADYRASQTPSEYVEALGPITLSIEALGGPFRFVDYLTTEQAFQIAAALTTAAMEVERTDGVEQDLPF